MRIAFLPLALAIALAAGVLFPALAANASPAPKAEPAARPAGVPLVLGERTVVTFRAAVQSYTPADRAEAAKRRLVEGYRKNPKGILALKSIAEGTQVLFDGAPMFAVIDADVNTLGGDTTESVARRAMEQLQTIVEELEERRDPRALSMGAGLAVAVTLAWILLLRLVLALDRRIGRWAAAKVAEKVGAATAAGVHLLDVRHFIVAARGVVRVGTWAVVIVLSFAWLNAVLETLPYTRPWGDRLTDMLLEVLGTVGTAILDSLPGLLFVVVIFVLARMVANVADSFFDRVRNDTLRMGWLDRDTVQPTRMVFTFVLWLFAFAMAYPYIPGSQSQAFQGLSVLVGLMVSLGASSTVGQAASGLILMFTRAFRVGDFVKIGDSEGTVSEIGLFVTRMRTGLGEEVMLPNTMVLQASSKNFSRVIEGPAFALDATVSIGYDTPWRQVHAMLVEAAKRTTGVIDSPAPRVVQTELSDFYVVYRLIAAARVEGATRRADALGELHANIQDVFNEHGVQIMSPHYLGDPETAKVVPKARWYEAPARPEAARGPAG